MSLGAPLVIVSCVSIFCLVNCLIPPALLSYKKFQFSSKALILQQILTIICLLYKKAFSNHNIQSPEVTSKDIVADEELNDSVKTLREKLSSALQNISSKDDLVKQHSKVAEEAVAGTTFTCLNLYANCVELDWFVCVCV